LELQRLQEDGSADPGFQWFEGNVRSMVVEPIGNLLTLAPQGISGAGFNTPCSTVEGVITGDGYGQELRIEAGGAARFIDYEAVLVGPW
jgi:hypothetical protein